MKKLTLRIEGDGDPGSTHVFVCDDDEDGSVIGELGAVSAITMGLQTTRPHVRATSVTVFGAAWKIDTRD